MSVPTEHGKTWTLATRERMDNALPPDCQPAYVASSICVFGVATLAALVVILCRSVCWHRSQSQTWVQPSSFCVSPCAPLRTNPRIVLREARPGVVPPALPAVSSLPLCPSQHPGAAVSPRWDSPCPRRTCLGPGPLCSPSWPSCARRRTSWVRRRRRRRSSDSCDCRRRRSRLCVWRRIATYLGPGWEFQSLGVSFALTMIAGPNPLGYEYPHRHRPAPVAAAALITADEDRDSPLGFGNP